MARMLAVLGCVLTAAVAAQAEEPTDPKFVVFLHDQTVLRSVTLQADAIDFATRSGKLRVRPADLRRLQFGYHVSAATAKRMEALAQALDGKDFKEREAAQAEFVRLGAAAHPFLKARLTGAGLEMTGRLNDALRQIEEIVPADRLNLPAVDGLLSVDGNLTGQVGNEEIKVRADFGEATLKASQIRAIERLFEATATVAAEKSTGPDAWTETDLEIEFDTVVRITASGRIDLETAQPGTQTCGPDGLNRENPAQGGPGVLMGRIGRDGPVFPVGKETAVRTGQQRGKLYLHINPGPGGPERASGSYRVRLASGGSMVDQEKGLDPLIFALRQEIQELKQHIMILQVQTQRRLPNLDGIDRRPQIGKVALAR